MVFIVSKGGFVISGGYDAFSRGGESDDTLRRSGTINIKHFLWKNNTGKTLMKYSKNKRMINGYIKNKMALLNITDMNNNLVQKINYNLIQLALYQLILG